MTRRWNGCGGQVEELAAGFPLYAESALPARAMAGAQ